MNKHVVIPAPGSRGHVDPCVGLGVALRGAGYRVTVAADRAFRHLAETAGLGSRPLPGAIRSCVRASPRRHECEDRAVSRGRVEAARLLRAYMAEVNASVSEVAADADVVLVGELGGAGYHFAQAKGIPSLGVHVAPTRVTEPVHAAGHMQ